MKQIIQAFRDDRKIAIAGASNNKDNFGKSLMTELAKLDYTIYPVNPRCDEVDGIACVPTVKDLPEEVKSLILAVPAALTDQIIDQVIGTPIKRVWMLKGVGKGAFSETAYQKCRENQVDVVYGFCPMMFFGDGMHKFHFWLRKKFGKMPEEYTLSSN